MIHILSSLPYFPDIMWNSSYLPELKEKEFSPTSLNLDPSGRHIWRLILPGAWIETIQLVRTPQHPAVKAGSVTRYPVSAGTGLEIKFT